MQLKNAPKFANTHDTDSTDHTMFIGDAMSNYATYKFCAELYSPSSIFSSNEQKLCISLNIGPNLKFKDAAIHGSTYKCKYVLIALEVLEVFRKCKVF